jgi:hypothetical protein
MLKKLPLRLLAVVVVGLSVLPALAKDGPQQADTEIIRSMGFPPSWRPYAGAMLVWDRQAGANEIGGDFSFGMRKDLGHPVAGLLGFAFEGFGQGVGGKSDGGVRAYLGSRSFLFHAGIERSFVRKSTVFVLTALFPFWRGGPLGTGGDIRIDFIPARDRSLNFGLSVPLWQRFAGKTRPRKDHVALPRAARTGEIPYTPPDRLKEPLGRIRESAGWIRRFTTPFLDRERRSYDETLERFRTEAADFKEHRKAMGEDFHGGRMAESEIGVFHHQVDRAFILAADGAEQTEAGLGTLAATNAKRILLDQVIMPYNRLLGQRKTEDSLLGLGENAEKAFRAWLYLDSGIPPGHRDAVMYVFRSLVDIMEENRRWSRDKWGDSRMVWIPMHYALRLEDHDTQEELDRIIERAVGKQFTTGNDIHYIINEQFQFELARMILSAEDYHVLWIHDYKGKNAAGDPDRIGYRMTLEAYLRALTDRVKAYDSTGKVTRYMIILDQYYFESNKGKLWLELLENPLKRHIDLPADFGEWEENLRSAQEELRNAVAASEGLQAGKRRYGKEWLSNRVKVHIYITNPADFSFRSAHLADYLPFATDNVMRDHRKISFYDITELDPGRGEAIYTGMGVGEHYVGATWDDRAVLVRGPALVGLKEETRQTLLSQGIEEDDIPQVLRPLARPDDYDRMIEDLRARGWEARAMDVHNATGFGPKDANVVRAILYNLMPPGSHLYIPDSLWNGSLWGSMLVGASLRGCWVFVIAPALENAPSAGMPQMSRANELFARLVMIQEGMREEIEAAGGRFRVGIYNLDLDIQDQAARARSRKQHSLRYPWLAEVFPFHPSTSAVVDTIIEYLEVEGYRPEHLASDAEKRKPKIHLKSQFFASREALLTLVPREEWAPLVRDYIIARAEQTARLHGPADVKELRRRTSDSARPLLESWQAGLSPEERDKTIFYLTVGSLNENNRGIIMDGEVLFVVSDIYAMVAYLDFVDTMLLTTWVESVEELEELLPPYGGFWEWIGRYMKNAL